MMTRIAIRVALPVLIVVLTLCLHDTSFAQDIVVTAKGDSLSGKAKIMAYDVIDRIQLTEGKVKKQFTAVQVQTVRVDNVWYAPVRTDYGYRMMKVLQSGFLSLMQGRAQNSTVYDVYYLVRRDGKTLEMPNLTFKKIMEEFLADCFRVKEDIATGKLTRKDIETIVREFNACLTKPAIPVSPAVVSDSDARLSAIQHLKDNLTNSDIPSRSDAIDILNDMQDKIRKNQQIANYQIDGLRTMLKGSVVAAEVESLIELLKK